MIVRADGRETVSERMMKLSGKARLLACEVVVDILKRVRGGAATEGDREVLAILWDGVRRETYDMGDAAEDLDETYEPDAPDEAELREAVERLGDALGKVLSDG